MNMKKMKEKNSSLQVLHALHGKNKQLEFFGDFSRIIPFVNIIKV